MSETDSFSVDIKESAYEDNPPIHQLLARPDNSLTTTREYDSEEAAELDVIRLSELGNKHLRLQPADHDPTEYQAYIVSSGNESGGYGRTTRNASSGWEHSRKVTIKRDNFTCQSCGSVGGPQGDVELHVDHLTPQSAGGSDDPDNLQTLCRDCHMAKHGSSGPDRKATEDDLAQSIIQLATQATVPAFERHRLYLLLDDALSGSVSGRDLNTVLTTLIRYDRIEQMMLQDRCENLSTGEMITREQTVYYLVTTEFDPYRLSYSGKLQYDGEPIEYTNLSYLNGRQTKFDEFSS